MGNFCVEYSYGNTNVTVIERDWYSVSKEKFYTGKYLPVLFSPLNRPYCQRVNLRLDEFQCISCVCMGELKTGQNHLQVNKGEKFTCIQ